MMLILFLILEWLWRIETFSKSTKLNKHYNLQICFITVLDFMLCSRFRKIFLAYQLLGGTIRIGILGSFRLVIFFEKVDVLTQI